ncbi:MAG: hypothetical protein ABJB69_04105 [Spartobacteria bacterium]
MMTLPSWYTRMNARERMLSLGVAAIVFVLFNILVCSWLLGAIRQTHADVSKRNDTRKQQAIYVKERDLWTKRDQWLQQHQPVVKSPAEASTLLDQLKQIAAKQNVLIENPQIGAGETTPNHQTVFASIETKSPWPPLVHFLYDVQQPEAFIVFESVNLAIDNNDPTMMRGKFRIARWFAPTQRKK